MIEVGGEGGGGGEASSSARSSGSIGSCIGFVVKATAKPLVDRDLEPGRSVGRSVRGRRGLG
jgi:hypothetical protein